MLKTYFRIALRNLIKNKIFSLINIFGLMMGLTSFILIALYVFDELTYDSFHKNANNTYRLVEQRTTDDSKETQTAGASYQLSTKISSGVSGIKTVARIRTMGRTGVSSVSNPNTFYEEFWIANTDFLKVFDFFLIHGDRNTALSEPHSAIVTEETARKIFGITDVTGRTIKIDRDSVPFKITAVIKNFPANSHINFNLCFSESSITSHGFLKFINSDWNSNSFPTYVVLDESVSSRLIEAKLNTLISSNVKKDDPDKVSYRLQPLKDIHFYSDGIEKSLGKPGDITYIYTFTFIAFLILVIACINYINLTTSRFLNRSKEIAVRKVAGASRKSLNQQFLSETLLVTFISLICALVLAKILLPAFNSFTEKKLSLGIQTDYRIWIGVTVTIFLVTLLSGLYPALFQSSLKPLSLLKNKVTLSKSGISLRRSLVVFQFALSIVMIMATIVVYVQLQYIKKKDMGFNKDQLLVIDINSGKIRRNAATIKTEFSRISGIKDVSVSSNVPGEWKEISRIKIRNQNIQSSEGTEMYFIGADDKFLNTFRIKLAKGRAFSEASQADSTSVLINETAARQLGITNPSGQLMQIPGAEPVFVNVIGIVKDFNFQSLREHVAPMVIGFENNPVASIDYFTVRITSKDINGTLPKLKTIIQDIDQSHLFEYHFLDKQWDLFYIEDHKRETIFFIAAALTILIACMGLFGLATYAAEQRIKEIGIRKVLGASTAGIISMLLNDFLKLVFVAALLAFPLSWWIMHTWLQDFAYHISITWWMFALSGAVALMIATLTITSQTMKAAVGNPVKNLRTE